MTDSLIGKHIVFEGVMFDRYVAREVVGETEKFWETRHYGPEAETRRKKKTTLTVLRACDTRAEAELIAVELTARIALLREQHARQIATLKSKFAEAAE